MDKRIRAWGSTFCFISALGERVAASIGWIGSAYTFRQSAFGVRLLRRAIDRPSSKSEVFPTRIDRQRLTMPHVAVAPPGTRFSSPSKLSFFRSSRRSSRRLMHI